MDIKKIRQSEDNIHCPHCLRSNLIHENTFLGQTKLNRKKAYFMVWKCYCGEDFKTKHQL